MYNKVKKYIKFENHNINKLSFLKTVQKYDTGNDFEKIIKEENKEILDLLSFLSSLNNNIFSRMSGSGSCCYATFSLQSEARKAFELTSKKYNNYWVYLTEN